MQKLGAILIFIGIFLIFATAVELNGFIEIELAIVQAIAALAMFGIGSVLLGCESEQEDEDA